MYSQGFKAKLSEQEEQARVSLYLLKRAFLETSIAKDEALVREHDAERREVVPRIQEL